VAGRLQHRERVRSVICVGVLLTGCFYVDPVNRKPKIGGVNCRVQGSDRPCFQGGSVHRGDLLVLDVDFTDPEHHESTASFDWQAFQCTDGGATDCPDPPFRTASTPTFQLEVPAVLTGVPALRVELELRDELGAAAAQSPRYLINDPPSLMVRAAPLQDRTMNSFVVGGPIVLYATVGDLDEGPDLLDVRWDVIAPVPSAVPLVETSVGPDLDPRFRTLGKMLVPDRIGEWDVRITATDTQPDLPETTERHLTFAVSPDQPPCIAQSQPLAPPDGASVPIADRTVFQVAVVTDDLDPYPPVPGDSHFGTTAFEWSILAPGAPGRQVLTGATGNAVDFEPGAFTPGDIVELRVEIFDRKRTAIACPDAAATCAIAPPPSCIQRQTWRVEVR